jgi:hypothetical protein
MTSGLDRALGHAKQLGRLGDRVPPIEEGDDDNAVMRCQRVDGLEHLDAREEIAHGIVGDAQVCGCRLGRLPGPRQASSVRVDGQVAGDREEPGSRRPLAFGCERRRVAPCANQGLLNDVLGLLPVATDKAAGIRQQGGSVLDVQRTNHLIVSQHCAGHTPEYVRHRLPVWVAERRLMLVNRPAVPSVSQVCALIATPDADSSCASQP